MGRVVAVILALTLVGNTPLQAGGLGGFLESLLARAVVRGAVAGASHYSTTMAPKVYGPNVLTPEQLAQCLVRAGKLDYDQGAISISSYTISSSEVLLKKNGSEMEMARSQVDQYSQASVDRYNAALARRKRMIDEHNSNIDKYYGAVELQKNAVANYNRDCAEGKQYYGSDLEQAKIIAGIK